MATDVLRGKVALVTGGSRGIGAAIARRLAADGADVGEHQEVWGGLIEKLPAARSSVVARSVRTQTPHTS